jgi:hypothetical protein
MATTSSVLKDAINQVTGNALNKETKKEAKPVKEVAQLNGESHASMAAKCGIELARACKLEADAVEIKKQINVSVKVLHSHKVVVGRRNKCSIAGAFYDACVDGGLSAKVSENYLSVFRTHVASGREIKDWNASRGVKASTEVQKKEPKSLAGLLMPAFNHNDGATFKALCLEIQNSYEDADCESIWSGFVNYLQFSGIKIDDEGDKIEVKKSSGK